MVTFLVDLSRRTEHMLGVECDLPTPGADTVYMPSWTPGSYSMDDHGARVRGMEGLVADSWQPMQRLSKSDWALPANASRLRYRVIADKMKDDSSHADATHATILGTSLFVTAKQWLALPQMVALGLPRGWRADSTLAREGRFFRARDYHELVDSPIEAGEHRVLNFHVLGKLHRIAIVGTGNEDKVDLGEDFARIVKEAAGVFGSLPYDQYLFILHLRTRAGAALEHRDSMVAEVDRWGFHPRKKYRKILSVAAHELFHAWNVKLVQPAGFVEPDYRNERYSSLLWAFEGITGYYDQLLPVRAGLVSPKEYRQAMAARFAALRRTRGRRELSLSESSLLAWTQPRTRHEEANTAVSYYTKGELLGLVLDLQIRERTHGKRSLDDVLRALVENHAGKGIGADEWRGVLERAAGGSWSDFWRRYVDGTDELPIDEALRSVGWRLEPADGEDRLSGSFLGLETALRKGRLRVKTAVAGSPAYVAKIGVGDHLVALDGVVLRSRKFLDDRLLERRPGDRVTLTIEHQDRLKEVEVELAQRPVAKWKLTVDEGRSRAAREREREWLRSRAGN